MNSTTIYIKENKDNTVIELLNRIFSYTESYAVKNHSMPEKISMTIGDYNKIINHDKTLIDNNKILGLEISIFKPFIKNNYKKGVKKYEHRI